MRRGGRRAGLDASTDGGGVLFDTERQTLADGLNHSPRYGRWLLVILLAGAAARVAVIAFAEYYPERVDFPDSDRYLLVAKNIAAGHGPMESKTFRARTDPLYPYLMSVGTALGCESDEALARFGRIINVLFSLATIPLLAAVGWRLISPAVGLIAAAILAIDPILLFFNALVLTETAYIALLAAAVWAIVRARDGNLWRWTAIAGGMLGLSILCRSSGLFLPFALAPIVWHFAGGRGRRRVAATCVLLGVSLLMLTPNIARNYRLFGRFVPTSTNAGASLLDGVGPWADGGPGMDKIVYPAFPEGANELERDRLCRAAALRWIRENPGETLRLAWVKLCRTWSITINASEYSSPIYTAIGWLSVAPVFAAAIGGIWVLRRRPWVLALLLMPAVYFTLLHMLFVGSVRYRLPAMPFVFILAATAIAAAARRAGRRATD